MGTARSRRRRRVLGVVAALAVGALAATAGVTAAHRESTPEPTAGPLRFPVGYDVVLRPLPGETAFVLDACLQGGAARVRLDRVSAEGGEVRVSWRPPGAFGAGPASDLPDSFVDVEDDPAGRVAGCADGESTIELAVILPQATDTDAVVDGLRVAYRVDGARHETVADVRFTSCAAGAASTACG